MSSASQIPASAHNISPRKRRKVALASMIGTTLEWYDFQIYGLAAALVLPQLFFPEYDPAVGVLLSLATFGVGFFARPVGAVIFGHMGDRKGRKSALVITLIIMGVSTVLMGLLPTYETLGGWAAALLVILRLIQGIGLGGEWGGAVLMAVEHAPDRKRGLYGSLPQMGSPAGLLVATGVFSLVSLLPDEQFLAWGWRVPFLLSAVLVVAGLLIRVTLTESPVFEAAVAKKQSARSPVLEVFRRYPKAMLVSFGAFTVTTGGFYIYNTFLTGFATRDLGIDRTTILVGGMVYATSQLLATPTAATLSDRIGRKPVFLAAAGLTMAYAFPLFLLVRIETAVVVWIGLAVAGALNGTLYGVMGAMASELFPADVRYSGASVSYQLNGAIAGGLTPFAATALVQAAGGSFWPAPVYLIGLALISFVAVLYLRRAEAVPPENVSDARLVA